MKFTYKAIKGNRSVVEGEIDAEGMNEAISQVAALGLKPILIKPVKKSFFKSGFFAKGVDLEDKVFITRYLSLMLKVGIDMFKAINILIDDFDKPAVKELLTEIRTNLEKGQPFYTTFAKYPRSFSSVFVNLVKAGEVSGNLETTFEQLAISLEKDRELNKKIKSSLTYPTILFITSILVLILLVSFSLPKIANVFMSGGIQPPTFSRIVFAVGLFVGNNLYWLLALLVIIFVGGFFFFFKTSAGKDFAFALSQKVPIIKKVIKEISLQRFCSTFASLLSSGLPIMETLEITAESSAIPELRNSLLRISREGIAKGLTVGEAFRKETFFPKVVSNLVSVSERSGHIEDILKTLADFYAGEVESAVKSLVSFIEPVMLALIGVVIGGIALAIIVPVYQLTTSF